MRIGFRGVVVVALLVAFAPLGMGREYFVAVDGDDGNAGTVDAPFGSIERARDAIRELGVGKAREPITVFLRGGVYFLSRTIEFSPTDSGSLDAPIVYAAYKDEHVVISGGAELDMSWKRSGNGVFQADVSDYGALIFDQLFIDGQRQHMARYPNYSAAGPVVSGGGYSSINVPVFGGTAEDAIDPERVKGWSDPTTGFVHALHGALWGSHHYKIESADVNGVVQLLGGWQENRSRHGMHKKFRFVENIFEELDAPGEWFLDRKTMTLYVIPPEGIDLTKATLTTTALKELFVIKGTMAQPVEYLAFKNLGFEHSARVFMEPYEKMTRGDWSLAKLAAVYLEGARAIEIRDCHFQRLGGTAVYLRDYCRHVGVTGCSFNDICESAVVLVGDLDSAYSPSVGYHNNVPLDEVDLTVGPRTQNHPAYCTIRDNLIHDIGLLGKQTAGVFMSIARDITVSHNTIYNVPRSGITINDGSFGGHLIEHNDVFSTVRETGDHGPFNSWGRDRHWQTGHAGGQKSDQSRACAMSRLDNYKTTHIRHNRFSHVGSFSWGIDLDDGSSNYHVYKNLTLGCSVKLREGFFRVVENNVFVGPIPPGKHVCYDNNHDVIRRNIYVNTEGNTMFGGIVAKPDQVDQVDYNLYYCYAGDPVWRFSGRRPEGFEAQMSLQACKRLGYEAHSLFADPMFVDPSQYDYRVRPESPARTLGFENFPMDDFGAIRPAYRQAGWRAFDRYINSAPKKLTGPTRSNRSIAWLGATVKNLVGMEEMSAAAVGQETGVLFVDVPADSPAARVGFKAGDLLLQWDDRRVHNLKDLQRIYSSSIGKSVSVRLDGNKPPRTLRFVVPAQAQADD